MSVEINNIITPQINNIPEIINNIPLVNNDIPLPINNVPAEVNIPVEVNNTPLPVKEKKRRGPKPKPKADNEVKEPKKRGRKAFVPTDPEERKKYFKEHYYKDVVRLNAERNKRNRMYKAKELYDLIKEREFLDIKDFMLDLKIPNKLFQAFKKV